jgi:hypothetical protein
MSRNGIILGVAIGATVFLGPSLMVKRHLSHHDSAFCALLDEIWGEKRVDRIRGYQEYLDSGFINVTVFRPPFDAHDTYKGKDANQHSMEILNRKRLELTHIIESHSHTGVRRNQ